MKCKGLGGGVAHSQNPALKDGAKFNKAPEGASADHFLSAEFFSQPLPRAARYALARLQLRNARAGGVIPIKAALAYRPQ